MKVFLAVARDLISFARTAFFNSFGINNRKQPLLLQSHDGQDVALSEKHTTVFLPETKIGTTSQSAPLNANFGWISVAEAALFARPLWVEDSVICKLKLGQEVSLEQYSGRFVYVRKGSLSGWVLKEEIQTDKQKIWPQLTENKIYLANEPATESIRALLADEFFTASLFLPLRDTEWVTYRLLTQNLSLPWGLVRPRTPGLWHKQLRGLPGITVSLEAKTGSIMEVFTNDMNPFLAYVEAVSVDGAIKISSVGRYLEGEYRIESLTQLDLQNLQPVFIVVQ